MLKVTRTDIAEWVENMIDEDGRGRFHRLGLRLERLEATLGQIEKRLCDGFGQAKAYPLPRPRDGQRGDAEPAHCRGPLAKLWGWIDR